MNHSDIISLYDQPLQSQQAAKCDLLVRISGAAVTFAVTDHIHNQLKALFYYPVAHTIAETVQQLHEKDAILKYHYRKIKIAAVTPHFTFIPAVIYQAELLPQYAAFIQQQQVQVSSIKTAAIKTVFSAPSGIQGIFPSAHYFSQAEPFIEAGIRLYDSPDIQLFLQFNAQSFEVMVTHGKELRFYNLFQAETTDDFNYFLLFVLQQLNLEPAELTVILSGAINENDGKYERIKKYFGRISFADSGRITGIGSSFSSIPAHRFFSLLSLNLCE